MSLHRAEATSGLAVAATATLVVGPGWAAVAEAAAPSGTGGREASVDFSFSAQPAVGKAAKPRAAMKRWIRRFVFIRWLNHTDGFPRPPLPIGEGDSVSNAITIAESAAEDHGVLPARRRAGAGGVDENHAITVTAPCGRNMRRVTTSENIAPSIPVAPLRLKHSPAIPHLDALRLGGRRLQHRVSRHPTRFHVFHSAE